MTPLLLTAEQAAERLGVCVKTLRQHVRDGEITYVLVGSATKRFTMQDLEAFIERGRKRCIPISELIHQSGTTASDLQANDIEDLLEYRKRKRKGRPTP